METQRIKLNLIPNYSFPEVVKLKQYDSTDNSNGKSIAFLLYNGDEVYNIPSTAKVVIRGTKPDNTGYEYECTYSGNEVTVNIQTQMTIFAGKYDVELRITSGKNIVGSANFKLDIQESALKSDTDISKTELPALETNFKEAIDSVKSSVETCKTCADTVATEVEKVKATVDNVDMILASKRSIVRGKDITSYFNDGTLWTRIKDNFDDIYIGDYFDMGVAVSAYEQTGQYQTTGSRYVTISELNPEIGNGDKNTITYNHIECIPGQFKGGSFHFGRSRMNATNTASGGYVGSEMFTTTLGAIATEKVEGSNLSINQQLFNIFGTHLKTFRALLTNDINTKGYNRFGTNSGCSNSWGWQDVQSVLLSEMDVYGGTIWSSSGYDSGTSKTQKTLFRLCPECINNRSSFYWLRDVSNSSAFAIIISYGYPNYYSANVANRSVRPRFILSYNEEDIK